MSFKVGIVRKIAFGLTDNLIYLLCCAQPRAYYALNFYNTLHDFNSLHDHVR